MTQTCKSDRDFTVRNDENGWNYRLVFENHLDKNGPPLSIYVNRYALASISPVFEKIFFDSCFVDSSKPQLPMGGKNFTEFLEFIQCIAITFDSDDRKAIEPSNIQVLLQYADEYAVGSLRQRCLTALRELPTLYSVKTKEHRSVLELLLHIASTVDPSLLPALIAKICRFPLTELQQLKEQLDTTIYEQIVAAKVDVYVRLRRIAVDERSPSPAFTCMQCAQLGEIWFSSRCPLHGDTWAASRRAIIAERLDNARTPLPPNELHNGQCSDCQQPFRFADDVNTDECACPY